ncbi:aspartic peptidase domain-containing protein [Desarmillaria tabescens]|uniref:Aspartic peptidase domain-containing protein n=1 Tax=Armillaria tabescens TaxID=1929756 RepID=A0AA39U747_ARMTA|nr:aspartic peptidase domain-containing protein [Desarmillaria tabescens]KAK0468360.1 aspartic peptidase domain-containing protein [Desarmillaria tabescens]
MFLGYLLVLLGLNLSSFALKFPIQSHVRRTPLSRRSGAGNYHLNTSLAAVVSNDNGLDLSTVHDLIYMANVTAGNITYVVQLDTGSSDLWLKADIPPLQNSEQTGYTANITYGIGWVNGTISHIPIEFAGISVESQAYLDTTSAQNPALGYGAKGILGLGFTSLSNIDSILSNTGSSQGRSLLYNLFAQNPSEPNFIAFSFQRSTSANDDVNGTFNIGEYEEAYSNVSETDAISTWPVSSPKRWSVLVEALLVGNQTILPSSSTGGAPSNKAVVVLDTGTSYSYTNTEVAKAIYGGISGSYYDSTLAQWSVPCNAEIDMAIQIAGKVYPLHPLDVAPTVVGDNSTCVGSFLPENLGVGTGQFDWLFGANVLRSMYSVYDFGDFDSDGNIGNPYVKLLSLTDPDEASAEFCQARGCTALTGITYNASNNTEDSGSTVIAVTRDVANTLEKFSTWFPAMLGIMALNALVILALLIFGIVYLCKRKRRPSARMPMGRLSPMPMNPRNSYVAGSPHGPHTYEPVSMAITDDTVFGPPSPAFHKFEGSTLRPGDRPKSLATLPSRSYDDDGEDVLTPPSPGFRQFDTRPKSVGILPSQSNTYQQIGEDQPFVVPPSAQSQEFYAKMSPAPSRSIHSTHSPENIGSPRSPSTSSFHQSVHDVQSPSPPRSFHQSYAEDSNPPLSPSRSLHQTSAHDQLSDVRSSSIIQLSQPQSRRGSTRPPPVNVFEPHMFQSTPEDQDFVPPSPGFRASENRPRSVGQLPSQTNPYKPMGNNSPLTPPSPVFRREGSSLNPSNASGDRPMSIA